MKDKVQSNCADILQISGFYPCAHIPVHIHTNILDTVWWHASIVLEFERLREEKQCESRASLAIRMISRLT